MIVSICLHLLLFPDCCLNPMNFLIFHQSFSYSPLKKVICVRKIRCRCDNRTLMSVSDGLRHSTSRSLAGKDGPCEGKKRSKGVFFPPESAFQSFMFVFKCIFPYLYLDLACKHLCFSPRKGINRRNESTKIRILVLMIITSHIFAF